jgi:hypothetical protein
MLNKSFGLVNNVMEFDMLKCRKDKDDVMIYTNPVFIAGLGDRHGYKYCILVKKGTPSGDSLAATLQTYSEMDQSAPSIQSDLSEIA